MMVGQKRKASYVGGSRFSNDRKQQAISKKTKVALIKQHDCGEKMVDVAHKLGMNRSTIAAI